MRVVLDTNVLARGISARAGPVHALRASLHLPHQHVVSDLLIDELARMLRYPRLLALHRRTDAQIDQYVADVRKFAVMVNLASLPIPKVVPNDPSDDVVIATAIAGHAERIVTRDKHLRTPDVRAYCAAFGVSILDDLEFLAELRGQQSP